jgi:glycerol-3-phosphate dehydrogenase (NAD(P)+)
MRVTVLGTGAWGTTLADLIAENQPENQPENQQDVLRWSRRSAQPLSEAIAQAEVVVSAISMKGVADISQQVMQLAINPAVVIVSATKGLAPGPDVLPDRPSQIWSRALPHNPVVILSGPNLSKEIQQGLPAAAVAASASESAAIVVQTLLNSQRFRVYTNADPIGVELAGALKNVMAIATGACDGLALGTNARSALVTRGLAEMVRIAVGWGAQAETLYGLAGVGDLMATCSSPLSRNYQVGYRLAQGETIDQVLATLEGTAEGINTTQVLMQLVRRQRDHQSIELPITEQVDRLIQGDSTPAEALNALMSRVRKAEV